MSPTKAGMDDVYASVGAGGDLVIAVIAVNLVATTVVSQ